MFGHEALDRLLRDYEFRSVLDIGCGQGLHSMTLAGAGKDVTSIDLGHSLYARHPVPGLTMRRGLFQEMTFDDPFDAVWACHVLEHQLDPHGFLVRVREVTREGGAIAITVPPAKHQIVGGHVSLWNAGLLLYRLVLAGLDCSEARVGSYGYNISAIVRRRAVELPELEYDAGDLRKLRHLFPPGLPWAPNDVDDPFDGHIVALDW